MFSGKLRDKLISPLIDIEAKLLEGTTESEPSLADLSLAEDLSWGPPYPPRTPFSLSSQSALASLTTWGHTEDVWRTGSLLLIWLWDIVRLESVKSPIESGSVEGR